MNTFSFLHQKRVKTSLSLVSEFTGADVSLDKAVGGGRGVWGRGGGSGGPQVLQPKRKAERGREKETWHQVSWERRALETAKRTREGQPPSSYYCISRCTAQTHLQYCQTTATVITGKSVMKHLHARLWVFNVKRQRKMTHQLQTWGL